MARRGLNTPLVAAVCATIACAVVYWLHARETVTLAWLDTAEVGLRDARFKLRGPIAPKSDDLAIVVLDNATRARHPEVFQRRYGHAKLIDALAGYAPAVV